MPIYQKAQTKRQRLFKDWQQKYLVDRSKGKSRKKKKSLQLRWKRMAYRVFELNCISPTQIPGRKITSMLVNLKDKVNINNESIYCGHWEITLSIGNGDLNAGTEMISGDYFESKYGKQLMFLQLMTSLNFTQNIRVNSNIPCTSCLCEIWENCCLLVKGLNKWRKKVLQSFPTNPDGILKTFSCNSNVNDCMLDICSS